MRKTFKHSGSVVTRLNVKTSYAIDSISLSIERLMLNSEIQASLVA